MLSQSLRTNIISLEPTSPTFSVALSRHSWQACEKHVLSLVHSKARSEFSQDIAWRRFAPTRVTWNWIWQEFCYLRKVFFPTASSFNDDDDDDTLVLLFFFCHLFEQKQVALKAAQNMSLRSIWIFALETLTFRTLIMPWLSTPAVVMMHLVRVSWHDGHVSRVVLYTKTYIVCFKGSTNCPIGWIHHLRWSIYEIVCYCFGWYSMW